MQSAQQHNMSLQLISNNTIGLPAHFRRIFIGNVEKGVFNLVVDTLELANAHFDFVYMLDKFFWGKVIQFPPLSFNFDTVPDRSSRNGF